MIINIGHPYPSVSVGPTAVLRSASPVPPARATERDMLEVSNPGEVLACAVERSSLRIARTRAIRAEILAGTYETPERINGTVARVLDVIA